MQTLLERVIEAQTLVETHGLKRSAVTVLLGDMRAHLERPGEAGPAIDTNALFKAISYSEQEALKAIAAELSGPRTLLVASRIADQVGITRSVVISLLRKLEIAKVVKSQSLGMKGTMIQVLIPEVLARLVQLAS